MNMLKFSLGVMKIDGIRNKSRGTDDGRYGRYLGVKFRKADWDDLDLWDKEQVMMLVKG